MNTIFPILNANIGTFLVGFSWVLLATEYGWWLSVGYAVLIGIARTVVPPFLYGMNSRGMPKTSGTFPIYAIGNKDVLNYGPKSLFRVTLIFIASFYFLSGHAITMGILALMLEGYYFYYRVTILADYNGHKPSQIDGGGFLLAGLLFLSVDHETLIYSLGEYNYWLILILGMGLRAIGVFDYKKIFYFNARKLTMK